MCKRSKHGLASAIAAFSVLFGIFLCYCTPCEAQQQKTAIENLLDITRETFLGFRNSRIEYSSESGSGISTSNIVRVNADGTGTHFFSRSNLGKTNQFEHLFNLEQQGMFANQLIVAGERPVKTQIVVTGLTNWLLKQSDIDAALLFGFVWDGSSLQDLAIPEFYKTIQWDEVSVDRLKGCLSNGGSIELLFVQKASGYKLSQLRIVFPESQIQGIGEAGSKEAKYLFTQYQIESTDDGLIIGWTSECRARFNGKEETISSTNKIARESEIADFPVRFDSLKVVNGTRVSVLDDPGVEYEYFDGVFRKVIDKESIDEIDKLLRQSQCELELEAREARTGDNITNQTVVVSNFLRARSNVAHCDIYSLSAAAATLRVDLPVEKLLSGLARFNGPVSSPDLPVNDGSVSRVHSHAGFRVNPGNGNRLWLFWPFGACDRFANCWIDVFSVSGVTCRVDNRQN